MSTPRSDNPTVTLEWEHNETHFGDRFVAVYDATAANPVLLISVGDEEAHMVWEGYFANAGSIALYEAPTASNDGTEITEYSRNRKDSGTAATTVYHTPTTSANGNLLDKWVFTATGNTKANIRSSDEWVLKPGTKYLLKATMSSGTVTIKVDWYE